MADDQNSVTGSRSRGVEAAGIRAGALYVVGTPIGNLDDFSVHARDILAAVDRIYAEDTRVSQHLLTHWNLRCPLRPLHEHNETRIVRRLIADMEAGTSVALISDAGMPLISDPGYVLVSSARAAGVPVFTVPGPSAVLAALSISGLPTDRFVFEGFLPHRAEARRTRLQSLAYESRTTVLFEASHRIRHCADDCATILGQRRVCIARELTKRFEESALMAAHDLPEWFSADGNRTRGEFVLVVEGAPRQEASTTELDRILQSLLRELPVSTAARVGAELAGCSRRIAYQRALMLGEQDRRDS